MVLELWLADKGKPRDAHVSRHPTDPNDSQELCDIKVCFDRNLVFVQPVNQVVALDIQGDFTIKVQLEIV